MNEELEYLVRRKLNITWNDPTTDARVHDIMDDVTPYLEHKLGVGAGYDFTAPGTERSLYLSCCLYEWDHIPRDEWEANYARTIANVQARHTVAAYLKEAEPDGDDEEA